MIEIIGRVIHRIIFKNFFKKIKLNKKNINLIKLD